MAFFSKKENQISQVTPGYEETERRTPKVGYILLIAMFVASLFFGWQALDDLRDVPRRPEALSRCAMPFIEYRWEDFGRNRSEVFPSHEAFEQSAPRLASEAPYKPFTQPSEQELPCVFSSLEKKYGIPAVFDERKGTDRALQEAEREFAKASAELADLERQYGLGLQEREVKEIQPLFPTDVIRQKVITLREKKSALEGEVKALKEEIKPHDENLRELYKNVMRDYRRAWRWYEFKVFLLESLFVFPFFLLVFWLYRKLLSKNSPYTIIATALVGVASVLMLRILLVWIWSLFLARIIQTIWEFIQNFALLKGLVFYGGMVLSITLFGGAVYLLQKRIFDPRRVAIRRLRDKRCPNCQTSLDVAVGFCPNCGRKLKEQCAKCGKERWADFPSCPHCGFKN